MQAPQVSGSSHKTVLLSSTPTSDANCKSQVVHCTSDPLAINRDSLLGINSLLEWLIELRETLGLTILVIKGMISDVGESTQKRYIHNVGKGRQLRALFGFRTLQLLHVFNSPETL